MPEDTAAILDARSLASAHRRLAALLAPGLTVLDAGCGTGAITRGIAEAVGRHERAVGVDVNTGMIEKARAAHGGVSGLSRGTRLSVDRPSTIWPSSRRPKRNGQRFSR